MSTRVSTSPTKGGGILIEVHISAASVELTPQGCRGIWIRPEFTREARGELHEILLDELFRQIRELAKQPCEGVRSGSDGVRALA